MFAEPQVTTVNAVADDLNRIEFGNRKGVFANPEGTRTLTISHDVRNRARRTVRMDYAKVAADPLLDGVSKRYTMSVYFVIDHPLVGFSIDEIQDNLEALIDWSTDAQILKVIGGES